MMIHSSVFVHFFRVFFSLKSKARKYNDVKMFFADAEYSFDGNDFVFKLKDQVQIARSDWQLTCSVLQKCLSL